jgi:hypothetical protein
LIESWVGVIVRKLKKRYVHITMLRNLTDPQFEGEPIRGANAA